MPKDPALRYACPTCGARPSKDCVTAAGNKPRQIHAARTEKVKK